MVYFEAASLDYATQAVSSEVPRMVLRSLPAMRRRWSLTNVRQGAFCGRPTTDIGL
jgi:hypothetical protein